MDRRVLVVDDDLAMLKLLSKYLTAGGYEVFTASSGKDALAILHREAPPIVLSDWNMPEMDGIELCRAIRAIEGMSLIYIIILTAQSNKECVVEALEAGANDFLNKPFHHQELIARLNAGMRVIQLEAGLLRERRELRKINAELATLNQKLEQMATTDELTSLANRREAMKQLQSRWKLAIRYDQPFSCIMLDVDHFKKFNDTYGHDVGDLVLKRTVTALQSVLREGDIAARIGGEEFLVLCSDVDSPIAIQIAERYRAAIAASRVKTDKLDLQVTISLGVASRSQHTTSYEQLLKNADEALYWAKESGRNKVVLYSDGPPHKTNGSVHRKAHSSSSATAAAVTVTDEPATAPASS